jgi:GNAT superfamily N-acetyltransferase
LIFYIHPELHLNSSFSKNPSTMSNPSYSWTKIIKGSKYIISNDPEAISRDFFQKALASDDVDWADPVSPETMELMIKNACTIGIYVVQNEENDTRSQLQIGFARIITDYATLAYLTDVYIQPEYRNLGIAKWLMAYVKDILDAIPSLRRSLLLTGASGKGPKFYEQALDMKVFQAGDEGRVIMMQRPKKQEKGM